MIRIAPLALAFLVAVTIGVVMMTIVIKVQNTPPTPVANRNNSIIVFGRTKL